MTTVADARAAVRARLTSEFTAIPAVYPNEGKTLDDAPAPFAWVEIIVENYDFVAFGSGRGGNTQRTEGRIEAQIIVPRGHGVDQALGWAESICAVFRGQRFDAISYGAAEAQTGEGSTPEGNYIVAAVAVIDFWFDRLA